ncbi:MAG TPA: BlaI/MecI/CopY family transcriptional regulator [Actinomycetaceae bacterium]|nr:BlaI/MecI/CopY family transcriptional regulator [Actinomycetaceae bacterium]
MTPPVLGPLEARVMDALWENGPASVRDVIAQLGDEHAYSTIATVLTHLDGKELVSKRNSGRNVHYLANMNRQEHCARLMEAALSSGGDRAAAIECFVSHMTDDDAELVRAALDRRLRHSGS